VTLEILPMSGSDPMSSLQQPARCGDCPVRNISLCGSLSDEDLLSLNKIGRRRIVRAGQIVSWEGDPANSFANIVRGVLKVTALTMDGREQIVGLLFPGDFVGQLFSDRVDLTVTAITEADLCTYSRTAFEDLLDMFPSLERLLLKRVLASLNDARDRMLTLGRKTAQERVAGFIDFIAKRLGKNGPNDVITVEIPVSRGEMADYLGLTIETISRQLTRLRAMSIIAFGRGNRECHILAAERLRLLVTPD